MSLTTCGCGGCGCSACQPALTIYQSPCPDPGVTNFGAALPVLDQNFCPRRLANPAVNSFLVGYNTPQGYQVLFANSPQVALDAFPVVSGGTIGNLVVEGSDNVLRQLTLPSVAGLYLSTNASGQLVAGPLPPASVPDPLSVTTLNATTATIGTLTVTGQISAANMATGTVANLVGIDAGGNLVKGAPAATGVQVAMFFESNTSPSASTPNSGATAGSFLVIGNLLYDSGGAIVTVTTSQILTVQVAGKYVITWDGQVGYTGGGTGRPSIALFINGVLVNNGNSRPTNVSTTDRTCALCGMEARPLAANDTIQLQLGSGSGTNTHVYEVRLIATKIAD